MAVVWYIPMVRNVFGIPAMGLHRATRAGPAASCVGCAAQPTPATPSVMKMSLGWRMRSGPGRLVEADGEPPPPHAAASSAAAAVIPVAIALNRRCTARETNLSSQGDAAQHPRYRAKWDMQRDGPAGVPYGA